MSRGLVRCPADGLLQMLDEADIPYEIHRSKLNSDFGGQGFKIIEEGWVPPETIAIVRTNRPLSDKLAALRKFSRWYNEHRLASGL